MLSVPYAADVPRAMIEVLEHHARQHGVSLEALEKIGATLDGVETFIVAAEDGKVGAFLADLFGAPMVMTKVERARWQAARLFG